jgi:hypothetical protein
MQLSAAGVAAAGLTYLVLPGAAAAASAPPTPPTVLPPSPPPTSVGGDPDPSDAGASFFGSSVSVIWQATAPTTFNYTYEVRLAGALVAAGTLAAVTAPDTTFSLVYTKPLASDVVSVTLAARNQTNAVVASVSFSG